MRLSKISAIIFCFASTIYAHASPEGENIMYLGIGKSKSNQYAKTNDTAGTIGFVKIRDRDDSFYGGEISAEGTSYHNGSPETSASINLIFGRNFTRTSSGRLDGAFLIGGRRKSTSCPSSYIGYRCYADSDPDASYAINYGALLTWTQKSILIGARITGESNQIILGFKF
jgi:hypothetical protein